MDMLRKETPGVVGARPMRRAEPAALNPETERPDGGAPAEPAPRFDPAAFIVPRDLVEKYNTRGPRYTSYPTAPEWRSGLTGADGLAVLRRNAEARASVPLSLYVHIPFCIKLCYYCGCNRIITRNETLVERYLDAVDRETALVAAQVAPGRRVVQIHWGGGTPTHLDPDQIKRLFGSLSSRFDIDPEAEISIEVHPTVTRVEHLEALRACGFNRLSMGIQDFDPKVQQAVNRPQSYEQTAGLIDAGRALGFGSINVDLMYGLPLQTLEGFSRTLALVKTLRPDRVALFNYAHVPHLQKGQRMIDAATLPAPELKLELLETAILAFLRRGYRYIGMDHFARPEDELARAREDRSLRRNFMGYTTCADSDLVGLGVSSISDLDDAYLQNHKGLEQYFNQIDAGVLPTARGLDLTADDRLRRDVINRLICHGAVEKGEIERLHGVDFDDTFALELTELAPLREDGLVWLEPDAIRVTPRGQMLLRNVCMPFDAWLRRTAPEQRLFSKML